MLTLLVRELILINHSAFDDNCRKMKRKILMEKGCGYKMTDIKYNCKCTNVNEWQKSTNFALQGVNLYFLYH